MCVLRESECERVREREKVSERERDTHTEENCGWKIVTSVPSYRDILQFVNFVFLKQAYYFVISKNDFQKNFSSRDFQH